MGMFDELKFEAGFEKLPKGLPRKGWQTKDLDAALCHYLVQPDGLLVRQRYKVGGGKSIEEINPRLNAKAVIYDSGHSLLLIIQDGYVIDVRQDWHDDTGIDEGWIPWTP